ncbi:Zinc finger SWIM-type [Arabidopsis suecica]|uniref:Zinc finger SWIM-type n=1 Tax=Arabidopsis suecica TaxID=45249 RepID=A0A8T2AE82_ARASU|nr:Zinc finger SWIM-type [Arabidopsis suecica]
MDGEAYLEGEEQKGEDEDEIYRFDCCDDSDGASSGDEDYGLSYKLSDEETDDEDEADEEKLEVEEEENAEEAAVKDEEDEEMVDVQKKEENRIVPIGKRVSITAKEYVQLLSGGVAIAVGQKYESKFQLVIRMKIISVLQQFDFVVSRSTPWVFAIKCWVKGCNWRVRATLIDASGNFHIKVYVNQHTCSVTERSARCRQATKDILAVLYKNFVGGVGPGVLPNHVSEALKLRYGIKVGYWKAHRTLKYARELVRGSPETGYQHLPEYLYMIRRANPGTLTRLEVDELDRFKYVFISFGASIDGFTYMRKVIVVDDDHGLAIISDRHNSIAKAIRTVYPQASRGICTYHLHKNIKLRFRGSETFGLVKKAATAYRLVDLNATFDIIKALYPDLHNYLVRADITTWSRVHFPGDRYNFTTSNIAESLNKVLNPARRYPIVELLDDIRLMLTRWYAARRKQAALITTILTKGVEKALESRVIRASKLSVQEIDPHQYEVRSLASMNVVNLKQKKCTCRMFDLDKLPCIHAIAAAESAHVSTISKAHPYYRLEYLRNGYSKSIMPKDEACSVPDSVTVKVVNPPFVKVQSGRPKVSRIKGHLEVASPRKVPRKAYACSNCGNVGHNRLYYCATHDGSSCEVRLTPPDDDDSSDEDDDDSSDGSSFDSHPDSLPGPTKSNCQLKLIDRKRLVVVTVQYLKYFSQHELTVRAKTQDWLAKLEGNHAEFIKRHGQLVKELEDLERGIREMEAHPKDWVKNGLDRVGPIPDELREYCVTLMGGAAKSHHPEMKVDY